MFYIHTYIILWFKIKIKTGYLKNKHLFSKFLNVISWIFEKKKKRLYADNQFCF